MPRYLQAFAPVLHRVFHSYAAVIHNAPPRMNVLSTRQRGGVMDAHVEPLVPMNRRPLQASRRLVAAAVAERAELERGRSRLLARREQLSQQLADLDAELGEMDERLLLIGRLAGDTSQSEDVKAHADADTTVLRGPAIRAAAVRVLIEDPRHRQALHYRDWFELLGRRGYVVAGKDPLAVFLTQLNRSPAVRRGTQSGVYELDVDAPNRMRRQLDDLQRQLTSLATGSETADPGSMRSRRGALTRDIDKREKALEEAQRLLVRRSTPLAAAS